jgi:hypothetical protein
MSTLSARASTPPGGVTQEAKLKTEVGALKDKLAKQVQRKAASQAAAKPKQPVKPKPAVKPKQPVKPKPAVKPKTKEANAAARIVSKALAVGGTAAARAARGTAALPAGQATVAKKPQRAAPRSRTEAVDVTAEPAAAAAEGASGDP